MSPEEAVQDAIETCRVQGGDLFFVIKKNVESDGRHLIVHLIDEVIKSPTEASIENLINEWQISNFSSGGFFLPPYFLYPYYRTHKKKRKTPYNLPPKVALEFSRNS